jgi:Flp pilus assembly protein TadG
MTTVISLQRLLWRFCRCVGDSRGVAAIEFAMLAPWLLVLYLGTVEVSQGLSASRKVTMVSETIADLVARSSNVTTADLKNIFDASVAIMAPFKGTVGMTVSCLTIDANGKATVAWSYTQGGSLLTVGSTVTLDPNIAIKNTSVIFSQVSYDYDPTFGDVLTGVITLKDRMYMAPRLTSTVTKSP